LSNSNITFAAATIEKHSRRAFKYRSGMSLFQVGKVETRREAILKKGKKDTAGHFITSGPEKSHRYERQ
jgi:hypothetical protein